MFERGAVDVRGLLTGVCRRLARDNVDVAQDAEVDRLRRANEALELCNTKAWGTVMELREELETEKLAACELCITSHAKVTDIADQLSKKMVEVEEAKEKAGLELSVAKKDLSAAKLELSAAKMELAQVNKEARLSVLEQRHAAGVRLVSYVMAGNDCAISQLSQWHRDNFQGGMDLDVVACNKVIRINETEKIAKERGKTLLWSKMGPIDLNDPNLGVSKEMLDVYVLTNDIKNERGVRVGSEHEHEHEESSKQWGVCHECEHKCRSYD